MATPWPGVEQSTWLQFSNALHWVLVENILVNAGDLCRVKIIEADVEINGRDWDRLTDQKRLGFAKEFGALPDIRLQVGLPNQVVVALIPPAGAIVAAVAGEQIEKSVGIIVIADPARGGE